MLLRQTWGITRETRSFERRPRVFLFAYVCAGRRAARVDSAYRLAQCLSLSPENTVPSASPTSPCSRTCRRRSRARSRAGASRTAISSADRAASARRRSRACSRWRSTASDAAIPRSTASRAASARRAGASGAARRASTSSRSTPRRTAASTTRASCASARCTRRPATTRLQGLHRRRSAHAHARSVERAAQDSRGAAAARRVRLRDDRAAEDRAVRRAGAEPPAALRFQAHRPGRDSRAARRTCWRRRSIAAEPEALAAIARAADGSMRDALSLTDQVLSMGDGKRDGRARARRARPRAGRRVHRDARPHRRAPRGRRVSRRSRGSPRRASTSAASSPASPTCCARSSPSRSAAPPTDVSERAREALERATRTHRRGRSAAHAAGDRRARAALPEERPAAAVGRDAARSLRAARSLGRARGCAALDRRRRERRRRRLAGAVIGAIRSRAPDAAPSARPTRAAPRADRERSRRSRRRRRVRARRRAPRRAAAAGAAQPRRSRLAPSPASRSPACEPLELEQAHRAVGRARRAAARRRQADARHGARARVAGRGDGERRRDDRARRAERHLRARDRRRRRPRSSTRSREWFAGVERVELRRDEQAPAAPPKRLTDEMVRAERIAALQEARSGAERGDRCARSRRRRLTRRCAVACSTRRAA